MPDSQGMSREWIASGMAEVEDHLIEFLVRDKNDTLENALSRKAEDRGGPVY